jgi:hypothetical protein
MSAAILLNTGEIRRLQFRAVSPSKFVHLGRTLHRTAKIIKKEWHNFSPDDRNLLKEFADELIEPHTGLPTRLWAGLYMLFIRLRGQEKEFLFCLNALDCLIDAILDAIERENPDSQKDGEDYQDYRELQGSDYCRFWYVIQKR